jgi:YD repeat-containing protein
MKFFINLCLIFTFIFGFFTTCQKKEDPPAVCNLTGITMSNGRTIEISYNDLGQITKILDNADTFNSYHTSMVIRYNSQNFFASIEKYDNHDKITDSIVFEYPDNSIIKSIIYRNTTGPMIHVFYKNFYFNTNGLLHVDSLYTFNGADTNGAHITGYTKYTYNLNNNVSQIDYYDNPGNGFAYLFGWKYGYTNSEMPTNTWINFLWTSYLNPFFSDSYIIPLRYNIPTSENFTNASGNYDRIHSYEYNTKENPVKEVITEPGLTTTINYIYSCN